MENPVILIIIAAPILVVGILWITLFNSLVQKRNAARSTFSGIDIQLKKRRELIPNLVAVVKGYAAHEKELFESITQARTQAMHASSTHDQLQHEATISQGLPKLIALAESYPNLKADAQFLNLQRNLTEIESQISAARRAYNATVKNYNNAIESFPSNIVAGKHNFKPHDFFSIESPERTAVSVSL